MFLQFLAEYMNVGVVIDWGSQIVFVARIIQVDSHLPRRGLVFESLVFIIFWLGVTSFHLGTFVLLNLAVIFGFEAFLQARFVFRCFLN